MPLLPHHYDEHPVRIRLSGRTKQKLFRRIAEAALRMEFKAKNALRTETMELFEDAVCTHFSSSLRRTIRDSYRRLEWRVSETCGDLSHLPSETTFRRRIARGGELADAVLSAQVLERR